MVVVPQAFRFGVREEEALKAIDMAFELAPTESPEVYKGAMKTLALVPPPPPPPPHTHTRTKTK